MLKENGNFSVLCELKKRWKSTEGFYFPDIHNKEAGRNSVAL